MTLRFVLNDQPIEASDVDPHVTLLEWLRSAGFTGSKEGCAEGECGACAVAWLRRDTSGKTHYEAVNSCLVPLPAVDGQSLVTVEGVAGPDGELHPVQELLIEKGGSQCGYCTPGFVISLFCEYYRSGREAFDPESIGGNLCRCTGYRPILDAGRALPPVAERDPRSLPLLREVPLPPPVAYEAGGRRFFRPATLAELFALRDAHPDATYLAGGTDLMVYANQRHQRWPVLIALEAIPELQRFDATPAEFSLGAALSLSALEVLAPRELSVLRELWPLFSSRLIRNRATLGGNLATASPIGDTPPALLALDASVTIASAHAQRRLSLGEFFLGYRKTALAPGELILSVHVPRPVPALQRFYKVSKRKLDDISTVAAAFALDLTAGGRVERLRIAYGGVAATPLRATAAERAALGRPWNEATLAALLPELDAVGTPIGDHRGTAAYRRAMVGKLLEKFFHESSAATEAAE